jgi:hypothetical protein
VEYTAFKVSFVDKPPALTANAYVDSEGQVWEKVGGIFKAGPRRWTPKTDDQSAWVSDKIKLLVDEGKPRDQAVAIAHSMAEEHFEKDASASTPGLYSLKSNEKETEMNDMEKAGKKIGPHANIGGMPAGAQRPMTPALEPMPARGETGATEGSKKDADMNEGRPGGPHAIADTQIKVPDGQGDQGAAAKDATAAHECVPGQPCPEGSHDQPMGKEAMPPACKECGQKLPMKQASAPAEDLKKAFSAGIEGLQKTMLAKMEEMSSVNAQLVKRVERLEKSPMPGGPARTELPNGLRPMEKASAMGGTEDDAALAIEKAALHVADPFTRDKMLQEAARLGIKKAQAGRARPF